MQYSQTTLTMKSSMIRDLVAVTKGVPGMISFAGGFPNPSTFPKEILADCYRRTVLEDGADVLQYGASEGDAQLKAELLRLDNDPEVTEENLLLTSGATHAIYLFTRTFVDRGDVVLSESPSFLGSLVAMEAAGAKIVGVESDDCGILPENMEKQLVACEAAGKKVKFLYVISDFQNPTGVTTTYERREEIIRIARKHGIAILEDTPYGRLRYFSEPVQSFRQIALEKFNDRDTVTVAKSFSKILGPGLRLGYLVGNAQTIHHACSWMQKTTVTVDCVSQRAVARFLREGNLLPQVARICDFYRPQLQTMLDALEHYMPKEVCWTRPEGGMFLWVSLPENINTDDLFLKARDMKVAYVPGSKFYPSGVERTNSMRLNFSYPTSAQIEEGVKRLAKMIEDAMHMETPTRGESC